LIRALVCVALLGGVAGAQEAPAPPPDDDLRRSVDELKARADAQDKKIAALTAALDSEAAARRAAEEAARERPALFRLGGLAMRLSGFVQADAVAYDQASADEIDWATGQPINRTRFLVRRARLRVEADYRYAGGVVEFDGNTVAGPVARITNAEVYGRVPQSDPSLPPYVMAVIGLTRIPFGFEVQEKDYIRLFLERSNVTRALFNGEYDLGVKLQGGWRFLRYQLAVMNGYPSGDKQYALQDPARAKDVLGRLGGEGFFGQRVGLSGGVSALWGKGFHTGTPPTKDTLIWHDTNLDGQVDPTELVGVLGQPSTPSQPFDRWAFGFDLRLTVDVPKLGPLAVYGELIWANNLDRFLVPADPIALGRDLRELGWYIAATQQLGRWVAVGLRYDRYDPDADKTEKVAASTVSRDLTFTTLSVVAALTWGPYARFVVEWDHNTNALGRTPTGTPTTLGSDQLTVRGQVVF
jgi:hypothetical protein